MNAAAQTLLSELDAEAPATRRVLERVPGDRLDWQPHAKSMTLGQLAIHLAGIPGRLSQLAMLDGFDTAGASFSPPQPESTEAIVRTFDESIATARTCLAALDEARAREPWSMRRGERVLLTIPRIGVFRTLVMNHSYHHRGQLSVYLRLLDVPVPVIYGRSADENPFAGE